MPSVRYQSMVLSSNSMIFGPVMGAATVGVAGAAAGEVAAVAEAAGVAAEAAGVAAEVGGVAAGWGGVAADAAWPTGVLGAFEAGAAAGIPADWAANAMEALSTSNSAGNASARK